MTLSIILPWFKKLSLFKVAVRQNKLFLDKRVQVVIVMDEPSEEKEAVEFIASVHHVNWKVIVNDTPHEWRPPCKAINVGIRNSTGDYVAVMSPETMLSLPTNEWLFRLLKSIKTKRFYLTGQIHNIQFTQEEMESPCFADKLEYRRAVLIEKPKDGFGFILTPRETIETINCYDEGRKRWGGDDDDIRIRLRKNKCKHICDPNIRLVHMWHEDTKRGSWVAPAGKVVVLTKQPNWGRDFERVAYETRPEPPNNVGDVAKIWMEKLSEKIFPLPDVWMLGDSVEARNARQNCPQLHPLTCGNDRMDEAHRKYQAEHGGDFGQLIAVEGGWKCPICDYTQPLRKNNETTENNTNPHHPTGNDTATVAQDVGQGLGAFTSSIEGLSPEQIEIIKASWNQKIS